ncbi:sigma-70 family RNA polymerase sigma factor [Methylobacillus gramineus]|uniref:sigma-70 family RNA polymerase sigma factor n=1 Tax=Methylobacillus gramineus TaxID=755169 RepID=UPI001CFFA84F|nr:sigma-70 family RNA polymerase sigma factor [Methylobacillus gramineus]MCB5185477.1 sigma-70 family RNA polymerase sigma factor [Methylobacillus gramineus]
MNFQESVSQQAVTALYSSHHGWLRGWLRRKLGCSEQAAELAHDTFLRIIAARNVSDIREPRDYLATIAKGLMFDLFRKQALERAYLDVLASIPEPVIHSLEERALMLEALLQIDRMLHGLKPKVRQAFLLSQLEALTYAEIAVKLKVTKRTVSNYMTTALEHCYDLMEST